MNEAMFRSETQRFNEAMVTARDDREREIVKLTFQQACDMFCDSNGIADVQVFDGAACFYDGEERAACAYDASGVDETDEEGKTAYALSLASPVDSNGDPLPLDLGPASTREGSLASNIWWIYGARWSDNEPAWSFIGSWR